MDNQFFIKTQMFFIFFCLLALNAERLTLCSVAEEAVLNSKTLFKQADVVLEVIPLRARSLQRGASVDAVENDPARLALAEAVVSFKLRRILKGDWIKEKVGGPTRLQQLEKAARKKNYGKLFGLNFTDPNEEISREWVSIAVEDPGKTFGIDRWDSPEPTRLKVYFKRLPENKNSFVLIGVIPSKK